MSDTDLFLQSLADTFCTRYFDGMPSVPIIVGRAESFKEGLIAHYKFDSKRIEVHPNYASDSTTIQHVRENVRHELIHAWVDWKNLTGVVLNDTETNWHNEYFFWKAQDINLNLDNVSYLFTKFPQTKPVWEKIRSGWNPLTHSYVPTVSTPPPPVRNINVTEASVKPDDTWTSENTMAVFAIMGIVIAFIWFLKLIAPAYGSSITVSQAGFASLVAILIVGGIGLVTFLVTRN